MPTSRPFGRALLTGLLSTLFSLSPALAQQDPSNQDVQEAQWGLGLMVGVRQAAYRDANPEALVLPMPSFENRWVRVQGPGLDLKLPALGPVRFALRARLDLAGYTASDSPALTGMEDRKSGFLLGGEAVWRNSLVNIGVELLGDVSGNSQGTQAVLSLSKDFRLGRTLIAPRMAARRLDSKMVDYYYGVEAGEVLANRSAYEGRATVNVELGLRTGYALAPRQLLFLDFSATKLGTGIADSPLVENDVQAGVNLGYLYRF